MSIALAVVFMLAIAVSLVEMAMSRRTAFAEGYFAGPEAQASHIVMNGAMAWMVLDASAFATRAILVALAIAAAILAVRLGLRAAMPARRGEPPAATIYHLLALAAMAYATLHMPPMPGMAMAPRPGWLASAVAIVFAIDALLTFALAVVLPRQLLRMQRSTADVANDQRSVLLLRLSSVPHIVMDLGMVAMVAGLV